MEVLNHIDKWFGRLIHHSYQISGKGVALFRILYALFFLVSGIPVFIWIDNNPDILFNPPTLSIANLFQGFPSFEVLLIADLAIIILLVFLLFGYQTKWTSILLSTVWIFGFSFKYSFGKIDHNAIVFLMPLVLAFTGWGKHLSIDANQKKSPDSDAPAPGLPIFLMALFIGFGYFSAGYAKVFTWLDFNYYSHGVRSWVYNAMFASNKPALLLPYIVQITNRYFWELLDITALLFELTVLLAVWKKKVFRCYLGFGVIFHFINTLMLYITFKRLMLVYLLFIDWEYVGRFINWPKLQRHFTFKNLAVVLSFYVVLYLVLATIDTRLLLDQMSILELILAPLFDSPMFLINHVIMSTALAVALFFGYRSYIHNYRTADT